MKNLRFLTAPLLAALLLSGSTTNALAADITDAPELSIKKDSVCIDTSYQVSTFLNEQKIVYPQNMNEADITSPYGPRIGVNPTLGALTPEMHTGTDFSQGLGAPIYTIASGVVKKAGKEPYGTGEMIVIEHELNGKKWSTMYLHLMDADETVEEGDKVITGQQIAREGKTGIVTGAHLHFEVWEGEYQEGKTTDPAKWLKEHSAVNVTDNSIPNFTCNKGTLFDGKIAAWGNYRNGEIPEDKLMSLPFKEEFKLEKEAGTKLVELNEKFKEEFKRSMPIVSAYKSLDIQNKESQSVSGSPLPGLSNAGWGKSIHLYYSTPDGGYKPFVDVSEYDPFDDLEYKWLLENAPAYGWVNPVINRKDSSDPNPERFIYVGVKEATAQPSKEDLQTYARIAMIPYNWTDAESQCLIKKWETLSQWNPALVNGDRVGIAQTSMVEKFGAEWKNSEEYKNFAKSPRLQIETGLKAMKDAKTTPCGVKEKQ